MTSKFLILGFVFIYFVMVFCRWSFLEVHTNGSFPDSTQAMAAGMTEGFLTGELMYKAYQNTLAGYCDAEQDFCVKLGRFLGENLKWISAQIADNPGDKYWYQVS